MSADFDVGRIRLCDKGMPSPDWHTTSLMYVIAEACSQSPWVVDGVERWGDPFKRHVAVTSAAGRLSERGHDVDTIVRFGFGRGFVGAVVAAACRAAIEVSTLGADEIPDAPAKLGTWLLETSGVSLAKEDRFSLFQRVANSREFHGFTGRVCAFVASGAERPADILCWRFPNFDEWWDLDPAALQIDAQATWVRDRFLVTYLDEWATESLHLEYRYQNGLVATPIPPEEMSRRDLVRSELEQHIAARHVLGGGSESGDFAPLEHEALRLLGEGNLDAAIGLFQGALYASPGSQRLQSNLAFCLIPVEPEEARSRLEALRKAGFDRELTVANLCTVAIVMGDEAIARSWQRELEAIEASERSFHLWEVMGSDTRAVFVQDPKEHIASQIRTRFGAATE